MNKSQIIVLIGATVLFFILYFGFGIIPPKQKSLEKSRTLNIEATSISNLIKDATPKLDKDKQSLIDAMNLDLQNSGTDTMKRVVVLRSLSGMWYDFGFPSIAGNYAEEIASIQKSEDAWSITGTTYALCVKQSTEDAKVKEFCSKRAVKAFEKAISLAPNNIEHRINLAICFVDNADKDNPMQGILMLRDLNSKYPENVAVLNQLGKLALQTNQIEKALERLESAIKLEPNNNITICLLATAYSNAGNQAKADEFKNKCVN